MRRLYATALEGGVPLVRGLPEIRTFASKDTPEATT
jgi:hypothetical protein